MKLFKSKKLIAVMAVVAIAAGATAAFAYFTSSGDGAGSGTVGTSVDLEVDTDAATGASLLPGVGTQTIKYRVTNPASFDQQLSNVAISVANANGTPWTSVVGCSKDDFSINGGVAGATANDTSLAAVLSAGATTPDGTITLEMVESGSDQSGCKNATVPLYLHAS